MNLYAPEHIAIIIVNYNNKRLTINCLKSIFNLKCLPRDIIIVDNGSGEYSDIFLEWKKLSKKYGRNPPSLCIEKFDLPSIGDTLIALNNNNGFSSGNNAAIRNLLNRKIEYQGFWLVNNDTILDTNALKNICKRMNSFPHVDIVGSTLINATNNNIVQCAAGGSISKITGKTLDLLGKTERKKYSNADCKKIEIVLII